MAIVPYQNRLKSWRQNSEKHDSLGEKAVVRVSQGTISPLLRQKPLESYIVDFTARRCDWPLKWTAASTMSRRAWSVTRSGPQSWDPWGSQYFAFQCGHQRKFEWCLQFDHKFDTRKMKEGYSLSPYKIAFVSLGCAKNLVNTEQMMALCRRAGTPLPATRMGLMWRCSTPAASLSLPRARPLKTFWSWRS